ncbi:multicopper oxidase family protein [Sulfitobacter sp. KE29]|jgi:FtsP/CotA-like multicopper oxidase with cupredoxin domain|uniref:Multicopper oxidase with three cupredoxin domains (Includes cell division protein FtsP and spore coat protein CotA) n=1 Tax=Sulfitobacter delicatus TaxID=218672 RepID=A0A1G7WXE9_9RHOB|nr:MULTISPECIES: multicopper oxidase family protein [Sulfitobacter]MDF3419549.1 multicopper oxidase family protein [Sulfitobacter sp. Ks38]MDF3427031.1 multicopper oxidase family protein [Sulfitobacter sp. KE29]MDF3430613.1 multicopper oxidase family protein [Sulfitobacter sp. S46]MDF3445385.1 multicopper oxidase family protein [Sulfitobacter sp. KE31]MDF3549410.1 multicopper oxidase family protein [Sulfitobacter sp. KE28]
MSFNYKTTVTRRAFVASSLAGVMSATLPFPRMAEAATRKFSLRAAPGSTRLVPEPHPDTAAWCYNGKVPGPEIRIRQGDRLQVEVMNDLAEETTVHWHGIRLPNAMDGVPHLTQGPIAPGDKFVYEFDAVDAGTFWYHPHQRSFEQVGRGLYGPLIVEEANPPRVDRDVTWVLDDWRLAEDASISDDFGNAHDLSHAGRLGNTVTINGHVPETLEVASGERIRLRLINAANARIFALDFGDHTPRIIALDRQPVTPHEPRDGVVVLGPAMRVDVILDCTGKPGAQAQLVDRAYRGNDFRVLDFTYAETALREATPDWPIALPTNPIPEPNLRSAQRHEVTFTGGMMGGGMMGMMHDGRGIWFVNGKAAEGHVLDPFLTLERGASHILEMTNATAFDHPIHLHGHSFRVISRNGTPTQHREWQDTVLMAPRERVEIAFVADNPGDWMFHCHILEHQAAGMMGVIRVA